MIQHPELRAAHDDLARVCDTFKARTDDQHAIVQTALTILLLMRVCDRLDARLEKAEMMLSILTNDSRSHALEITRLHDRTRDK